MSNLICKPKQAEFQKMFHAQSAQLMLLPDKTICGFGAGAAQIIQVYVIAGNAVNDILFRRGHFVAEVRHDGIGQSLGGEKKGFLSL